MFVELDIFSGRPNPQWTLDEREAADLLRLEADLQLAGTEPPTPPGLGYRGFRYGAGDGWRIAFGGFVRTEKEAREDPSFSVERFLMDRIPADHSGLADRIRPLLR